MSCCVFESHVLFYVALPPAVQTDELPDKELKKYFTNQASFVPPSLQARVLLHHNLVTLCFHKKTVTELGLKTTLNAKRLMLRKLIVIFCY